MPNGGSPVTVSSPLPAHSSKRKAAQDLVACDIAATHVHTRQRAGEIHGQALPAKTLIGELLDEPRSERHADRHPWVARGSNPRDAAPSAMETPKWSVLSGPLQLSDAAGGSASAAWAGLATWIITAIALAAREVFIAVSTLVIRGLIVRKGIPTQMRRSGGVGGPCRVHALFLCGGSDHNGD